MTRTRIRRDKDAGVNRTLTVATTRSELRAAQQQQPGDVGLVMTMGALHAGHAALIRAARSANETVVVTIFVNPMQFGPGEDFASYPRRLDDDLAVCAGEGVDVVFVPPPAEVYRGDQRITIAPGPLADELEGAARPGHFAGVLTVVHKLLHIVPDVDRAYLGEKDYQQLTLIRQLVHDLDLEPQVIGVPTVREADGLALSSRNSYLSPEDRAGAAALSGALFAGAAAAAAGATPADVVAMARARLDAAPGLTLDYLELRSTTLTAPPPHGPARLLAAVTVGGTRLLDNVAVDLLDNVAVDLRPSTPEP